MRDEDLIGQFYPTGYVNSKGWANVLCNSHLSPPHRSYWVTADPDTRAYRYRYRKGQPNYRSHLSKRMTRILRLAAFPVI